METAESRSSMKNSVNRGVFVAISLILQVWWIAALAIRLTKYSVWVSLAASLLSLLVVLRIYGENINAAFKISWIILILLFPVFGLCLFLLFGQAGANVLMRRRFGQISHALGELLPADASALETARGQGCAVAGQACYLQNGAGFPLYTDSDITFYGDTVAALEAQKAELRTAEKFIFMEYHAIEDSASWRGIEEILAEKAAAGVEVRVFYDDMGSLGFINPTFVRQLRARGIECRVFNPLLPFLNVFMNNRDHRKITVVDGRVGFTGGYNLADEYFNLTHPYGQWKDSGVKIEGSAVRSLTVIFLEMWGATQKEPIQTEPYLPRIAYTPREHTLVLPYSDSPLDRENVGENVYLNMINGAGRYLYLTTPYLILSDEMQRALALAAQRGVDVRIITPGVPDKKTVYQVTRSYYARLAHYGVRIFEYTPGFIHAKQFVCDDAVAAVGTINMDFRSLYLHFENGCWFAGCKAVQELRQDFEALFPQCAEVTAQYSGKRSLAVRGGQCILRLFSPLM